MIPFLLLVYITLMIFIAGLTAGILEFAIAVSIDLIIWIFVISEVRAYKARQKYYQDQIEAKKQKEHDEHINNDADLE